MSSSMKQGPNVSENEIAIGGTNVWKTAAIDDNTSFAFFFEVPGKESVPRGKNAMIQFQTLYQHSNGQTIMRVTTLAYAFGDPTAGKNTRRTVPLVVSLRTGGEICENGVQQKAL